MAVETPPYMERASAPPFTSATGIAPVEVFMQYVAAVTSLEGVREVRWSAEQGLADLFVIVEGIDPPAASRAHLLSREFARRYGRMPFSLHVIDLGLVDEANLPEGVVVFPSGRRG